MLTVGSAVPDFNLLDEQDALWSNKILQGKQYILYFYPKDDTPGCTTEACNFRDTSADFKKQNILIVGIGKGNKKDHIKFKEKYHLPFPLLVDTNLQTAKAFGVVEKRSMFGKSYDGINRTTFLIDATGTIIHIWKNVNPLGHAKEILSYTQNL